MVGTWLLLKDNKVFQFNVKRKYTDVLYLNRGLKRLPETGPGEVNQINVFELFTHWNYESWSCQDFSHPFNIAYVLYLGLLSTQYYSVLTDCNILYNIITLDQEKVLF